MRPFIHQFQMWLRELLHLCLWLQLGNIWSLSNVLLCASPPLLSSDVSWTATSQDQTRADSLQRAVSLSPGQESHALRREVPLQLQVCICG